MKHLFVFLLFLGFSLTPCFAQEIDKAPQISVSGTGRIRAKPDLATIRLGVEAQAAEAVQAQSKVNDKITKILQQLEKRGIPKKQIQTTNLQLYPVYSQENPETRNNEPPRVVAYRASNTLQIEVTDTTTVGQVIDAGTSAGANQLQGVSFFLKDEKAQKNLALRQAVLEARKKAETLADSLGVRLGDVLTAREDSVNVSMPHYAAMERAAVASTPVEPGEIEIQAGVTVQYRILKN
jgi:uncharacterized protein